MKKITLDSFEDGILSRLKLAISAKKIGVKVTYHKTLFGASWTIEGPDDAVKHFVEQHWQGKDKVIPYVAWMARNRLLYCYHF